MTEEVEEMAEVVEGLEVVVVVNKVVDTEAESDVSVETEVIKVVDEAGGFG